MTKRACWPLLVTAPVVGEVRIVDWFTRGDFSKRTEQVCSILIDVNHSRYDNGTSQLCHSHGHLPIETSLQIFGNELPDFWHETTEFTVLEREDCSFQIMISAI